jgi:hypothetical protein
MSEMINMRKFVGENVQKAAKNCGKRQKRLEVELRLIGV